MPVHRESRAIRCPRDQFFDLVADVESYPVFLPHWRSARIYRRDGNVYYTKQEVGAGRLMSQRFRSRTELDRPTDIRVTSDDSIFSHLLIKWHFETISENACQVDFEMSCDASSIILKRFMDVMLTETARSMVSAFAARARELQGPSTA